MWLAGVALLALTTMDAAEPAPPAPAPADWALTTPTAMIMPELVRFELREGLVPGLTLAIADRVQATGGVMLPVFKHASFLFGVLKLRLVTFGPLTLTAAAGRIDWRISSSFAGDMTGGSLLATYCFRADCRWLASAGLWYGEHSEVEDMSPDSYRGWFGNASVIGGTSAHTALLADAWFSSGTVLMGLGLRGHWRGFFGDLGFLLTPAGLLGRSTGSLPAFPWLTLGYGFAVRFLPIGQGAPE